MQGRGSESRTHRPRLLSVGTCQGHPAVLPEVRKEKQRLGSRGGTASVSSVRWRCPGTLRSVPHSSLGDCPWQRKRLGGIEGPIQNHDRIKPEVQKG